MPVDFPPWQAVYAFFERWSHRGLPQRLTGRLRAQIRVGLDRDAEPSAAVVVSQSVKAADLVGAATRGFDAGRKINGRMVYWATVMIMTRRLARMSSDQPEHPPRGDPVAEPCG